MLDFLKKLWYNFFIKTKTKTVRRKQLAESRRLVKVPIAYSHSTHHFRVGGSSECVARAFRCLRYKDRT